MRMKRRSICSLMVAVLATLPALTAHATVGDTFALQGRLVSAAGFPVPDGDYGLTVSFYKDATAPQAVYAYLEPGVKVQKGLFVLTIGSKTKLDKTPFLTGDAAWFGVQVGSDPEMPRLPLHQVPYALRAQMALALQCTGCITGDMLDASVLKDYAKSGALATVATSGAFTDLKGVPVLIAADQKCAAGTLVGGMDADGKVVCVSAPTYSGKDFALAGQACGSGLYLTGIDGDGKPVCSLPVQAGVACQLGQVVTGFDAAGKPICGAGVQAGQSCVAGQVVTGFEANGAPVCVADKVNVYGGKDFALANQACAAGQVVIGVDVDGKHVCGADANSTYNGKDFALANQACPAGQVLTGVDANGKPVCATDANNTYTGKDFALANQACPAGQVVTGVDVAGKPVCAADKNNVYSGKDFALAGQACNLGSVLAGIDATGKAVCVAGGTLTAVTASAPLASSGGATPNLTIAQATASAHGFLTAGDWTAFASKVASVAATTGGGLLTGGSATAPTLGLTNACGAGQILKWSGSAWACAADNDANSGGTVISVGAAAPVVSSGGPTPVLSMAQASAAASGYLTAGDWTTFASKIASVAATTGGGLLAAGTASAPTLGLTNACGAGQILKWSGSAWTCAADNDTNSGGTVTGVTASGPLASSGGATPNLTIAQATGSAAGFLAAADWTTFNSKVASLTAAAGGGMVTAGTATAPTVGLITSCASGQMLKWNGSAWACAADVNSGGTLTGLGAIAGGGLVTAGTATVPTVGLITSCASGQMLKWNGSAWACAADASSGGTVTAVTASGPLASSGGATPNLTIAQATVSAAGFLAAADWTAFNSKVASLTATAGGGLVTAGSATAPTVGLITSCASGQMLKWNGSAWACAADIDTNSGGTVTGVTAIASGGLVTAGSATAPTVGLVTSCASGQMLKWNGSAWACASDVSSGGTVTGVTATGPLASSGGAAPNLSLAQASGSAAGFLAAADWTAFSSKVASLAATAGGGLVTGGSATAPTVGLITSCASGQMLKWNGSAWACAADVNSGGTVTSVTASGPLASSGGAAPNLTIVQASASAAGFLAAADWSAFNSKLASLAATAGGGLVTGGTAGAPTVGLITSCAAGQMLKWNGTAWACAADVNSGGTVTSVTAGAGLAGGTITTTGTVSIPAGGVTSAMVGFNYADSAGKGGAANGLACPGCVDGSDVATNAALNVGSVAATGSVTAPTIAAGTTLTVAGSNVCRADGTNCTKGGVVYTRWGKNTCPTGTSLVYSGYSGGKHYTHGGGGTNTLCLSGAPTWLNYNDGNQDGALVYGMEYEMSGYGLTGVSPFNGLHDNKAPCAVCLNQSIDNQIMIPGTYQCPGGWTSQYYGYLMSTAHTQGGAEFVCVDVAAQGIGGTVNHNGNLWYPTEAECGSLPCGPYVQNRELTCVVCGR